MVFEIMQKSTIRLVWFGALKLWVRKLAANIRRVVVEVVHRFDASQKVFEFFAVLLGFGKLPKDLVESKFTDRDVVFVGQLDPIIFLPGVAWDRRLLGIGRDRTTPEEAFFSRLPRANIA